jgi:hypothetical protein
MVCCHEINKNEEKKFATQEIFVLALEDIHLLFMSKAI